jgi:hypothetical protein
MDFKGFSPESFEQFVRVLAIKVFGPGVTVFGNGPDGGREATFKGRVPYPFPPQDSWNGYGVIQAKFKEKIEGTKLDTAWAKKQLEDELKLWTKSEKRNPKPEYYIFCTNVQLSSARNGGRESAEAILKKYQKKLKLKGFAIWEGNQLRAFVDANPDLRSRFTAFFCTGDLLEKFAKLLPKAPDPDSILTAYLCREISADEDAKLSQAGDRSEDRIRLAEVFVDLPSSTHPSAEPSDEPTNASLNKLLKVAGCKLDPLALLNRGQGELMDGSSLKEKQLFSRFLFLGGPGSGKSTIGQFLAQIHRAAILDRRPQHRLDPKIREIVARIKTRCANEGIQWPTTPRFPYKIDLNNFAKAASQSQEKSLSLSEYVRKAIGTDFGFTHEDLREWVRLYPSMLILDGLDEVPSSSNRRQVIDAIQGFLNESRDVEADLMIVASSRPDGYAGEFDGEEIENRYLMPLTKSQALACAKRYVTAKIAAVGEQRGEEAMMTLEGAIENPLIARLMRSPLQVTFMVTVVAASGKPAESRWQLFNDYYRIIYERELHKAVRPFNQVLGERRQDIDALHHKVGFILQARAESTGGTQADLAKEEFEELVSRCLTEDGLTSEALATQKQMILGAANSRLVFLTSRTPGRLSFDVRSLQEYMAAACMTNNDSPQVLKTLEIIAHSFYWRNTLLFAVGRFFVEPQMRAHRDKIRLLCEDLNRRDADTNAVKLGSWLALDILESGTVGNVPMVTRSLASCALGILGLLDDEDSGPQRLAEVYDPTMEFEYKETIALWLGQTEPSKTYSAWILLLSLEKRGVAWAREIAEREWKHSDEVSWDILKRWLPFGVDYEAARIAGESDLGELSSYDSERLENAVLNRSPVDFVEWGFGFRVNPKHEEYTWLQLLGQWGKEEEHLTAELVSAGASTRFRMALTPLPTAETKLLFKRLQDVLTTASAHDDWKIIAILSEFYVEPCAKTLASTVAKLTAGCKLPLPIPFFRKLSWPLQCLLRVAQDRVVPACRDIAEGLMGDIDDWLDLEKRWASSGITTDDLRTPFFRDGPTLAPAVNSGHIAQADYETCVRAIHPLSALLVEERRPEVKRLFAWIIGLITNRTETLFDLDPHVLKEHLLLPDMRWVSDLFVATERFNDVNDPGWYEFFDKFGRSKNMRYMYWREGDLNINFYVEGYNKDPSRIGLVRLLALSSAAGLEMAWKIPLTTSCADNNYTLFAILIRLADPSLTFDEAAMIAKLIPKALQSSEEPNALDFLVNALEYHAQPDSKLLEAVRAVLACVPATNWDMKSRIESLRKNILQSKPSGFNEKMVSELGLPSLDPYRETSVA